MDKWDVSLGKDAAQVTVHLPAPLGKALRSREYNRAEVTVTKEGLLIRPYKGTHAGRSSEVIELPQW